MTCQAPLDDDSYMNQTLLTPLEDRDVPEYSGAVRVNAKSPPACFIILAFLQFSILGNHRFLQQSQHQQCRGTVWVEK